MKYACTLLPALALLSACSQADGELTPGNWKTTGGISKFDVPGAPPEMAAQIREMLGKTQTSDSCMSAEQAKSGVREFSSSMQQGDCKMEDFNQGGGKMSGKMVCKDSAVGAPTMRMEGTYAPQKVTMTMSGDVKDPNLPGGKASVVMTMTSERIGDCKR